MEAVIFIGIQATGKSTFYQHRFFHTHVRINLDMLRTRHREKTLLRTCLGLQQPFVVDNTNPTAADRSRYIVPAKEAGFTVVGYYFRSRLAEALRRNAERAGRHRIPDPGVGGTAGRLELPSRREGFDALHYVRIDDGDFVVENWREE